MIITSQQEMEEAAVYYGILPFLRSNIPGFSVEEMTTPGLLFGGNDYEGCWEWKGPVVRNRTTAYGKFFRRKAGFVSRELLPYFLKMRRGRYPVREASTDEMVYDIISLNDGMTSTDLRESLLGNPKRRTAFDLPELSPQQPLQTGEHDCTAPSRHTLEGPLQRLQMGGWLCISDFRYKHTKKGERYGWGVAEYSTPEMLFDREELETSLTPEECLDHIIDYVHARFPSATRARLKSLLA